MDLQRGNSWKRIAAWILDLMLLCVLAVGSAYGVSAIADYDGYDQKLQAAYDHYEEQYGITFDVGQTTYEAMTPEEKANYDAAYEALIADEEAIRAYNMVVNLSLLTTSLGILIATLVLEFIVPLLLKNGQTIGKKCFSLGVVRIDGVKITPLQLFARTLLGKYTLETMVPVYIVLMLLWGAMGITGTLILLLLLVVQVVCVAVGQNRATIHDRLAGTVVVDISSQKVFETTDDLIAYTKRIHAEQVKKQDY
ncbi:MAG: RDD family protein [Oscillospiraceae bacterium]|nr:RDD family protein [Oscillospiraceae bacterium]